MNELAIESFIDQEIKKFTITDAAIAYMRDNYMPLEINGINDKRGALQVRAARLDVKAKRIDVDKKRKELNENALKFQRAVNGRAKEIISALEEIETYLGEQENAIEVEKERLKQVALKEKALMVQSRISRLLDLGFKFNGDAYTIDLQGDIVRIDPLTIENASDDLFNNTLNEFLPTIEKIKASEVARLEKLAQDKRAEEEKLATERAELAKERAAIEAEKKRLADLDAKLSQLQPDQETIADVNNIDDDKLKPNKEINPVIANALQVKIGFDDFDKLMRGNSLLVSDCNPVIQITFDVTLSDIEDLVNNAYQSDDE